MVTFYTGTPGSGKSFHLARRIFDGLRYNKQNIIANFDINIDNVQLTVLGWLKQRLTEISKGKITFRKYNKRSLKGQFEYWMNPDITPERLVYFAQTHHKKRTEGQTLVIIDEAGIFYNCRTSSFGNRQQWLDFFAKHRHYGFDFILAAQFDRQVDKQIRMCVEYEVVHRKLKNFQLLGWLLATLSGGNLFICKQYWYASREKLQNNMEVLRYTRRISSLYDTYAEFSREGFGSAASGVRGPTRGAADTTPDHFTQDAEAAARSWADMLTALNCNTPPDEDAGKGKTDDTGNRAEEQAGCAAGADTLNCTAGADCVTT